MCDDTRSSGAAGPLEGAGFLADVAIKGFVPFCYVMDIGIALEHWVLLAEIVAGVATAAALVLAAAVLISRRLQRRALITTTPSFAARLAPAERRRALPAARLRAFPRPTRALPRPTRAIPPPRRALEGIVYDPAGRKVWTPPGRRS
jgi:hypothetical protein